MTQIDPNSSSSQTLPSSPNVLVSSKSIQGYTYDASSYVLTVWYKGKANSVYRYFLVYPNMVSDIFDSGGSIGSKASKTLKVLQSIKLR